MSALITKKERNTHDRIRRGIILVVTSDMDIKPDEIAALINIKKTEAMIRVLHTVKKGKSLDKAVRSFMKEMDISISYGDVVIYLDEEYDKGGGYYDCSQQR